MEEDLKILKVEYLSNHLLNHTQVLNLYLTILYKSRKWRGPQMEDDLKILQVEYLGSYSNFKIKQRWLNHILQIL